MKSFAMAMVALLVSVSLSGCGSLVSKSEYLDTMMVYGEIASVMAYVPPAPVAHTQVNRDGIVLATDLRLDDVSAEISTRPSSRAALGFSSDVRRQIDALTREMRLLESRAGLKGAPARAALEPKLRAFNSAIDRLNGRLGESPGLDNQADVDDALASAHQAAREAYDAVNFTRSLG